ncbi:MAG TPA: septation protein SepH, partial [Thermopolyspora sp.]
MQELRLVAVSEDGTYLVLATAGRGTRFTLPVDDRLRAAVRGNFSRLGQYEIEVESPLRPKEIQARIRAGETAEEIAATAGIPVERVRWFEGPVLQEREYMAQQAQRVAVRLPGESVPRPTLGELVAERLTRRGVPADEIDWDSCKRDDGLWRVKLGYVWNGHTRHAEWLFDARRRHVSPHDDEATRLSAAEYVEPAEDTTVTPFVPRLAPKLTPVPTINEAPPAFPSARPDPVTSPAHQESPAETVPVRHEASSRHEAAPPPARPVPAPSPIPAPMRHEPPALARQEPPGRTEPTLRPAMPAALTRPEPTRASGIPSAEPPEVIKDEPVKQPDSSIGVPDASAAGPPVTVPVARASADGQAARPTSKTPPAEVTRPPAAEKAPEKSDSEKVPEKTPGRPPQDTKEAETAS